MWEWKAYTCVYILIYVYIYVPIHRYIHKIYNTQMICMRTYTSLCKYIYTNICVYTPMYIYNCVYIHICIHIYVYVHVYKYAFRYASSYFDINALILIKICTYVTYTYRYMWKHTHIIYPEKKPYACICSFRSVGYNLNRYAQIIQIKLPPRFWAAGIFKCIYICKCIFSFTYIYTNIQNK